MTISFTCPHCGTQTDVFEEYAGRSGPCAVCGKPITVPSEPSAATGRAAAAADIRPAERRQAGSLVMILAVIIGGVLAVTALAAFLIVLVFPAVSAARAASHRTACASNLQALALALQKYQAEHGSYPPAYTADAKGKPQHSWRVLILPQLGYDHIYRSYDFTQPWDSPTNMQLLRQMPPEYACPADPDARSKGETSYLVAMGKRTMFPHDKSVKPSAVRDSVQDTILLVETRTCGVCWLQPQDVDADQMLCQINGRVGSEISSHHPDGAHVCTADGQPHFLSALSPPDVLQALLTIDGGETVPWYLAE